MSTAQLWTPEEDDALRRLWATGLSSAQVARAMEAEGFTPRSRNSVIGRCHRAELPRRMESTKMRSYVAKRKTTPRVRVLDPVIRTKPLPSKPMVEKADSIAPLNIPLAELEFGRCHEVTLTNEWGRPRYCGHVAHLGSRFCAGHHARNFVSIAPKPRVRVQHDYSRREDFRDSARWGSR